MPAFRLDAELERDAAQHESDQHGRDRQVEGAQYHAVRDGKRDQQQSDAQHQPGFVRVPERPDGRDHDVLLARIRSRHQHADAKVVAVQNDVGQNRRAHEQGENDRQVECHAAASCGERAGLVTAEPPPLPARWVSTTI